MGKVFIEQSVIERAISDFDGIRAAIIEKGIAVPANTPTNVYADKIKTIISANPEIGSRTKVFTSSQSFTVQESGWYWIFGIGGGGGGGSGAARGGGTTGYALSGGQGGGGIQIAFKIYLNKNDVIKITVGAGGTGGESAQIASGITQGNKGNSGGSTIIEINGVQYTAPGGEGGGRGGGNSANSLNITSGMQTRCANGALIGYGQFLTLKDYIKEYNTSSGQVITNFQTGDSQNLGGGGSRIGRSGNFLDAFPGSSSGIYYKNGFIFPDIGLSEDIGRGGGGGTGVIGTGTKTSYAGEDGKSGGVAIIY